MVCSSQRQNNINTFRSTLRKDYMKVIPYRLPNDSIQELFSFISQTLQEIIMPDTGRKAHLLTMTLNKDKRLTRQQKMNKRFKNAFQMVMRKPVLRTVNF